MRGLLLASFVPFVSFCATAFIAAALVQRVSAHEPPLRPDEVSTTQQRSLLLALASDPYGHRGADHCRAGCAMQVRPHAICSNTAYYGGYWVGGGLPLAGDAPYLNEGTFGWDYFGIAFNKRIALNWSHGRRAQGGAGAYRTDGPRLHK
jgi:hypothetical protein